MFPHKVAISSLEIKSIRSNSPAVTSPSVNTKHPDELRSQTEPRPCAFKVSQRTLRFARNLSDVRRSCISLASIYNCRAWFLGSICLESSTLTYGVHPND